MGSFIQPGVIHYLCPELADTRQMILREAGYHVCVGEPSIERLLQAVLEPHLSAALLADVPELQATQFAEALHSHSAAPVVLFAAASISNHAAFDCVIPPLTTPASWLAMLAETIAKCAATGARSRLLRGEAAILRSRATELRSQSRELREVAKSEKEMAEDALDGRSSSATSSE